MIDKLKSNFIRLLVITISVLSLGFIAYLGEKSVIAQTPSDSTLVTNSSGNYLEVNWPASQSRGAITFHIPNEYLHRATTWKAEDGQIKSFAVQFELPGPTPLQKRPWLKKGTPEYEQFMETWQGRYSMDVVPARSGGAAYRDAMRRQVYQSSLRQADISIGGLERYSSLKCFGEKDLMKNEVKEFLAAKEADDTSPVDCRLDRRWADLVSPKEVEADDEGVAISCTYTGCKAYFSVAGCGASMGISHADVAVWPSVVEPARMLIESFIASKN